MFAHIVLVLLCVSPIVGLILVGHHYDMKSTPKSAEVNHKTCKHCVDFAEEIQRREAQCNAPDTLGKLLGELLDGALTQRRAV